MRRINDTAYELLCSLEGFSGKPYDDGGGVWTIGYGHTQGVTKNSKPITQEEALDLLDDDLEEFEQGVTDMVTVPLTDNQFSALVLLCFNCGFAPLKGTIGRYLKDRKYIQAADGFLLWNKVNGKECDGLTKRREQERQLFLTPNTEGVST